MNVQELTLVFARIQALDEYRQVDELVIQAWEPLMEDVDYDHAVQAVNEHYKTSDRRIMPVHIIEAARRYKTVKKFEALREAHVHKFDRHGYCRCSAIGEPNEDDIAS